MNKITTRTRIRTLGLRSALAAVGVMLLLGAALPTGAAAKNQRFPSGNSGISQYLETIPTAGGGTPSGGGKSHHGHGSGSGAVPEPTDRAMSNSGSTGEQAAAFANSTAPAPAGTGRGTGSGGSASSGTRSGSSRGPGRAGLAGSALSGASAGSTGSSGNSPIKSVLAAFGGGSSGGGLGAWLPVLLVAILLGGGAIALRARHRRGSD